MSDVSEGEDEVGVLVTAKEAALKPLRYAVSKPAQRAYIGTFLIFLTSTVLLGIAATAYILFYYTYIPVRGFSSPIHLQFEPDQHPFGVVSFRSGLLASDQPYDVKVLLHMPRTATNRAAGNFMVDLQLFAPRVPGLESSEKGAAALAHQRRPAILTYYSPTMEHVHRAAALPWYILGFQQESEVLDLSLMEGATFSKGWKNVPTSARIELQSDAKLQVYSAELTFKARLRGLRYAMYNFRITSFLVLTGCFWLVEMAAAGVIWISLAVIFSGGDKAQITTEVKEDQIAVKDESAEGSEPSRITARPQSTVKKEDGDDHAEMYPVVEADDEDDEAGSALGDTHLNVESRFQDSGIGTSLESSSARPESVRRRGSRNFKREEQ